MLTGVLEILRMYGRTYKYFRLEKKIKKSNGESKLISIFP